MEDEKRLVKDKRIRVGIALTAAVIIFGSFIVTDNLVSMPITTLIVVGLVVAYLWTGGEL